MNDNDITQPIKPLSTTPEDLPHLPIPTRPEWNSPHEYVCQRCGEASPCAAQLAEQGANQAPVRPLRSLPSTWDGALYPDEEPTPAPVVGAGPTFRGCLVLGTVSGPPEYEINVVGPAAFVSGLLADAAQLIQVAQAAAAAEEATDAP